MMDTMIPQNQVQRVKQQDNQFKDFDKNYIEKWSAKVSFSVLFLSMNFLSMIIENIKFKFVVYRFR